MGRFTNRQLQSAKRFMQEQARPLENALFNSLIFDEDAGEVLGELKAFQNPDGGFGHGLEPDLRTEDSSALATNHALQILFKVNPSAAGTMIDAAISYLIEAYDESMAVWPIIPKSAEVSAHAPWWEQKGLQERFGGFKINPSAEVVGYLFRGSACPAPSWRANRLDDIVRTLEGTVEIGGDSLSCVIRLHQTPHLPGEAKDAIGKHIERLLPETVESNSDNWGAYCYKPLWAVQNPNSPWYELLQESLGKQLDFEIQQQLPNGAWDTFWNWGDFYPEAWAKARTEWQGILTLKMVESFKAFGKLENV